MAEPAGSGSPSHCWRESHLPGFKPSMTKRWWPAQGGPRRFVGLRRGFQVYRGPKGVWKQREVHLRPTETHPAARVRPLRPSPAAKIMDDLESKIVIRQVRRHRRWPLRSWRLMRRLEQHHLPMEVQEALLSR